MRKTSHDGGDSTSITSGVENEIKKSVTKTKKSSLKRKAPNFSHESDEAVIEPLLQKDKSDAKYNVKSNIDSNNDRVVNNKSQQLTENKSKTITGFCGTTESLLSTKDFDVSKSNSIVTAPLHNYMNTNVFNSHDNLKANVTSKSQILVEIDGNKQNGYNPTPLIFTTAKIHTNGKSKAIEPVQVTSVPILSTIEVSVTKEVSINSSTKIRDSIPSVASPVYSITTDTAKDIKVCPDNVTKDTNKESSLTNKTSNEGLMENTKENNYVSVPKISSTLNKTKDVPLTISIAPENRFNTVISDAKVKATDNVNSKTTEKARSIASEKSDVPEITPMSILSNQDYINANSTQGGTANADIDKNTQFTSVKNNEGQKHDLKSPTTSRSSSDYASPTMLMRSTNNKVLQRQKTLVDEAPNIPDAKTNTEETSAKTPYSTNVLSTSKIDHSGFGNDNKSPKSSANNEKFSSIQSSFNNTNTVPTNISNKSTLLHLDSSNCLSTPGPSDKNEILPVSLSSNPLNKPISASTTQKNSSLNDKALTSIPPVKPSSTDRSKVFVPNVPNNSIGKTISKTPSTNTSKLASLVGTSSTNNPTSSTTKVLTTMKQPLHKDDSSASVIKSHPVVTTIDTSSATPYAATTSSSAKLIKKSSLETGSESAVAKPSSLTTTTKSTYIPQGVNSSAIKTTQHNSSQISASVATGNSKTVPVANSLAKTDASLTNSVPKNTKISSGKVKPSSTVTKVPPKNSTSASISSSVTTISSTKPVATSNSKTVPKSVTSTKSTVVSTPQISNNKKSEGIAASTSSLSSTVKPPSKIDTNKKGGPKANANKSDVKASKT